MAMPPATALRPAALAFSAVLLLSANAAGQGAPPPGRSPTIAALEARAAELRLTPAQAQQLRVIDVDAEIEAAPRLAERRVLELKLRRQQLTDPTRPDAASAQRLDELAVQIARAEREAADKALAVLTLAQRTRLADANLDLAPAPQAAPAAAAAGEDSRLVTFEVSEAITQRLMQWAQWFLFIVAAPLTLFLATLTVWGVRSYADFKKRIAEGAGAIDAQTKAASEHLDAQTQAAQKRVAVQMKDAEALGKQTEELRRRIGEVSALEKNVRELGEKVSKIEQVVKFKDSKALTPELKTQLLDSISRYRDFLLSLGANAGEVVEIEVIRPKKGEAENAYYVSGRMVIAEALVGDADVLYRGYTHHVLGQSRPKRPLTPFNSIHSALADYLPCTFNDSPLFGEIGAKALKSTVPYMRNLEADESFHLTTGWEAPYVGAGGWETTFWALRKLVGAKTLDPILVSIWKSQPKIEDTQASWAAFANAVVDRIEAARPRSVAKARTAFTGRGLDLSGASPLPAPSATPPNAPKGRRRSPPQAPAQSGSG
jgi:hypothetical protein